MGVGDFRTQAFRSKFIEHGGLTSDDDPDFAPVTSGLCAADSAAGAGGVTLYQMADLVESPAANERGATGMLRQLLNAGSVRERERVIRRRLDNAGFEWLAYYTTSRSDHAASRRACMATFASVEWTRRYFERCYYEVDPRQEQIRQSSLPLVWDVGGIEDTLASRPQTARLRGFMQDFRDSSMGSGVFARVPTDGRSSGDCAVVSLGSSVSSRRWIDDRVLGEALVIGLSLHDYVSHHARLGPVQDAAPASHVQSCELPARQQAVLRHLAAGLTDRAIATQLGVSFHTVDYYLRQLRQHFAVRNRVQLVAAAAHLLT